ncbi:MAG: translocation/assembly module TamB domain-containing protein, partial [Gemmatimonadota bacterium]
MTSKERWIGIPLAFVGGVLALAVLAALVLTRTPWGHERVGELLEQKLFPRFQGTVRFAEIAGGDLLRAVHLTDVVVLDPEGEFVMRADTAELEYDWHDFLRGDVTFQAVELAGAEIVLAQGRDGRWNFARALATRKDSAEAAAEPAAEDEGGGQRIELRRITVRRGDFTARTPVDRAEGFFRTEEAPDGAWRVLRVADFDAVLPMLRIKSRSSGDPLWIRIAELAGVAHVVSDPVTVRDLRANVEVLDDTVTFEVQRLDLPGSRLAGRGVVRIVEPETQFDLRLHGERVALADVRWLVGWLPEQGRSRFDLRLASERDGLAFDFADTDLRIGTSHVTGRFGFVLGDDEIRFRDVDLRLDPLETRWIDTLTADTLFFQGLLRGEFRGDGPVSRMTLETDLSLESPEGGAPGRVAAAGVLTWDGTFGGDSLRMELDAMEMEVVEALLSPGLPLEGRLTGTLTFRGTLAGGLDVEGGLTHEDGTRPVSRWVGDGRITGATDPRVDLRFETEPLSLTTLAAYYPTIPFRGDVRGPVSLRGTFDELYVDARLRTTRGRLVVRGRFDLSGEPKRYDADLEGEEVQVAALRPGMPTSDLDFRARLEGSGLSAEELDLRGWIRILPSEFAGARVDSGYVELVAESGILVVDTARIDTEAGRLRARGSFGLREGTSGTLAFEIAADTLAAWNRWIRPAGEAPAPAAVVAFAGGSGGLPPLQDEPQAPGQPRGSLRGEVTGSGVLAGNLDRIDLEGRFRFADLGWEDAATDSLALTLSAVGPPRALDAEGEARAWGAEVAGLAASRARLEFAVTGDHTSLAGEWEKDEETRLRARGSVLRLPDGVRITVDSLSARLRGQGLALEAPMIVLRDGRTLSIEPFRLAGPLGTIAGEAAVPETGPAALLLRISGLDLGNLAAVFPDSLDLRGPLRVQLRLTGSPTAPSAEFEAQVDGGHLVGVEFSELTSRGRFENGRLQMDLTASRGRERLFDATTAIPLAIDLYALSVRRTTEPMELHVRAEEFPLAFALASFDQFRDVGGLLRGELTLRGTLDEPDLSGEIALRDGAAGLPEVGVRFFGAEGRVRLNGDVAELQDVLVRGPEGGRGRVEGTVRLRPVSNPEFDLRFNVDRLRTYNTRIAQAVVSGRVNLAGVYRRPVITGELTVESSTLFIREIERRQEIIDLSDPAFFSVVDTTVAENRRLVPLLSDPFFQNMTVDLTLHLARDSWLRGRDRAIE